MIEFLIGLKNSLPPEAITFLAAMLPITELRGSIPFAIQILHLSPFSAFFWSIVGNLVPNLIILIVLEPITNFLRTKSKKLDTLISNIFAKTRSKHTERFNKYGALFLIVFVAVPLPGSGSWSGSLIAFLFGVSYWRAITLIFFGIIGAGIIVTFAWEGLMEISKLFT